MQRFIPVAAVVALALPASASAKGVHGTVVHRVARAHSFVVADGHGHLTAVHSARRPAVGRVVTVSARRLANGTYSARSVKAGRRRRHARLRGTITHVDRRNGSFVLSSSGTSMVVTPAPGCAGKPDAADVGKSAVVNATLTRGGEVEADDVQSAGAPQQAFKVEGVVQAVDQTARTLTVSADDDELSGQSLVITVPAGMDMSGFQQGQEVELLVTRQADGSLTLANASSDDNQGEDQGGDHGDQNAQGDQSSQQQSGGQDQQSGGQDQQSGGQDQQDSSSSGSQGDGGHSGSGSQD